MFHMKHFTSLSQQKGHLGEKIALQYLVNKGFTILETNYTKKIGEIDIVAQKGNHYHFLEVKTIFEPHGSNSVSRETGRGKLYSPWQNVSREKLQRFGRTCELYIIERNVSRETKWQIDVVAVTITTKISFDENNVSCETQKARVEILWNVIP